MHHPEWQTPSWSLHVRGRRYRLWVVHPAPPSKPAARPASRGTPAAMCTVREEEGLFQMEEDP